MKKCTKCKKEKPYTDFYAHKKMNDGYLSQCKECVKDRVKKHRQENIERIREYDRNRPNAKERNEKNKERIKKLRRDPKFCEKDRERTKKWIEENKIKRAAHILTGNAIRKGDLIKQPCEVCGDPNVDAHHDDYGKPLDVRWLCKMHHAEHHKKEREKARKES